MTKTQKQFITKKLIPFIEREGGRGFIMQNWLKDCLVPGETCYKDRLPRKVPICGTVACIGGSIEVLKKPRGGYGYIEAVEAGKEIGLDDLQSNILFAASIRWPEPFRRRYLKAKTVRTQAKVAADLLREMVRTNRKVLY